MLCSKNKDKKSESNSQHLCLGAIIFSSCVRRTKIKNLKAIHNFAHLPKVETMLCSKNKDKKSESNSQHVAFDTLCNYVVFEEQR